MAAIGVRVPSRLVFAFAKPKWFESVGLPPLCVGLPPSRSSLLDRKPGKQAFGNSPSLRAQLAHLCPLCCHMRHVARRTVSDVQPWLI